jgi:REP element-mobilizing transposase RayT
MALERAYRRTMPRAPRIQVAGGIYHVTQRGNNGALLFRDAHDYARFVRMFWRVVRRYRWRCLTYCLMPNHYHLVVLTEEPNLAAGMRDLNGSYANRFNARYDRFGHVFRGRYGARLIESEPYLRATIAYVLGNPVRAGLCAPPEDWPWSYDAGAAGAAAPPVPAFAGAFSGTSQTTPSGGSVTGAENGWSCQGTASDSTAPRLPASEPP